MWTLDTQPEGATHWSTRAMARQAGMSQTMVSRIWRAFGFQPHRAETFKLSRHPALVDKVRDVIGLYLNPPDRALVLCVDEKPQIQVAGRRIIVDERVDLDAALWVVRGFERLVGSRSRSG